MPQSNLDRYTKMFGPEVVAFLKSKSAESLKKMIADQDLRKNMKALLPSISQAEKEHHQQLEKAAVELVKKLYPIINDYDIQIEANILDIPLGRDPKQRELAKKMVADLKAKWGSLQEEFGDPSDREESDEEQEMKRDISNALQQGGSLNGTYGFLFFRDNLKFIEKTAPGIVDDYKDAMNAIFGAYDTDDGVAYMMNLYANDPDAQRAGESRATEKNGKVTIQAWGINFPVLVHEIIKGLKAITIGWSGYASTSREKNQAIADKVDQITSEPEDLRYGKFLIGALDNIYADSKIDDLRVRDAFETEVVKLIYTDLVSLLSNALLDKLTPAQKRWIDKTFTELEAQWKEYDSEKSMYDTSKEEEDKDENEDDDDMNDFLGGLGIRKPD